MSEGQSSSGLIFTLADEATSGHGADIYHLAACEPHPAEGGGIHHRPPLSPKPDYSDVQNGRQRSFQETGLNESTLAWAGFLLLKSKAALTTAGWNGCLMQHRQI